MRALIGGRPVFAHTLVLAGSLVEDLCDPGAGALRSDEVT
jgi:hypothetical protein